MIKIRMKIRIRRIFLTKNFEQRTKRKEPKGSKDPKEPNDIWLKGNFGGWKVGFCARVSR